jgi:hypothetical protein
MLTTTISREASRRKFLNLYCAGKDSKSPGTVRMVARV